MTDVELSIIVKNYVTIASLMFGVGWAIWKWGFSVWLKNRNNIYSIDGDITVNHLIKNRKEIFSTISVIWKNKGEVNIELEPKLTRIYVYNISMFANLGSIDCDNDLGEPIHKLYPYRNIQKITLGSHTESLMEHHFLLKSNQTYAVTWRLYKKSKSKGDPSFYIERYILFNTKLNNQVSNQTKNKFISENYVEDLELIT